MAATRPNARSQNIEREKQLRENASYLARDLVSAGKLHKERHRVAAQSWELMGLAIGALAAIIGVVTGFLTGSQIVDPLLASVSSTVAGVLAAVQAFLKPAERVEANKRASDSWSIFEDKARNLSDLEMVGAFPADEKAAQLSSLTTEKGELTQNSPTISSWVEHRVPPVDIALNVIPTEPLASEKVQLKGKLIARDCRDQFVAVTVWDLGKTPNVAVRELGLQTQEKGFFSETITAPSTPGSYVVIAYHQDVQGRARLLVRAGP